MVEALSKEQEEIASISENLLEINEQIKQVQIKSKLQQNITLIAVSKIKPVSYIQEAYNNGQRDFGENYANELAEKATQLPQDIKWHFIGQLQSNKCKLLTTIKNLETVQSVDSIKLLNKLQSGIEEQQKDKILNIFIEVKTSDEDTKRGAQEEECIKLIQYLQEKCKNLKFAGLMTIGKEGDLTVFDQMQQLQNTIAEKLKLQAKDIKLSMGMSADYEEAVNLSKANNYFERFQEEVTIFVLALKFLEIESIKNDKINRN